MKRLAGCLFVLLLLAACSSSNIPRDIVGYWEGETLKQDMMFTADGRVEVVDKEHSTYTGTYRITDGNVLTCDMDQAIFSGPVVRTVQISGSELTLSEKSRKEVYHRRE